MICSSCGAYTTAVGGSPDGGCRDCKYADAIEHGAKFPYDESDAWWGSTDDQSPKPAEDWAHAAARGIISDLKGRSTIKRGFQEVDEDVRVEITNMMSGIIRLAAKQRGSA